MSVSLFPLITFNTSIEFYYFHSQEAVERTISTMDKVVTGKINTIKKNNALEKRNSSNLSTKNRCNPET